MRVSKMVREPDGWVRFNLGVAGFVIKNCRWSPEKRFVRFPKRRNKHGGNLEVVFARGAQVVKLRSLLESGATETPRDRRPCKLSIQSLRVSPYEEDKWLVFDFTVRGFTICGCRWRPDTGSIQLPVTFFFNEATAQYVKRRVVCAFGVHIGRLRDALEARIPKFMARIRASQANEAAEGAQEAA